jgi:hypothetical protein
MRPLENLSQILKIVTNSIIISPEAPSMTYSIQNLLHFSFQSLYHLPAEAPSMTYSIQDLLHFSSESLPLTQDIQEIIEAKMRKETM